ncbi:hypothetical protein GGR57DRAFT_517387 [Xylariaceae sp. FL1272]|nr:hypothetical protein GGR57DRAFT_517387 [Xylariaceae sp. FL1272]
MINVTAAMALKGSIMEAVDPPYTPFGMSRAEVQQFVREDWTLFAVGLAVTVTRTYARVRQVGIRGLQGDDYLVWVAMIFYAAEASLAYFVGEAAHGLANNGMTDSDRIALDPHDEMYHQRVIGSKIQLAGWATYSSLLWTLKASLLFFYLRLTAGLHRTFRYRIYAGFALLAATWISATLTLFLSCRPFHRNWQIYPDPGTVCYPATSPRVVWIYAILNVATDVYLISIPIPMLWQSTLKPIKKFGLIVLFSSGTFVIAAAFVRAALILHDPVKGAQTAGSWAVRETFVAVVTTNLPLIFPFIYALIAPFLRAVAHTFRGSSYERSSNGKFRAPHMTIGGGRRNDNHWRGRGRGPPTANPIPELTLTTSQERMLESGQIKLQNLCSGRSSQSEDASTKCDRMSTGNFIRKDVEVVVHSEPRGEETGFTKGQGSFATASGPEGL